MGTNAYYLNQFISTTLATVGGIDDSQTTGIILTSVTGVETTKPGIVCLSYSDPIDTSKAEWISYTSISVTNELQGVTRGAEGFSAKSHSNGVAVAFPISRSHINNLNDALIIGGVETNLVTGVIDDDTMATASATTLATSESTKAYVDNSSWFNGWNLVTETWTRTGNHTFTVAGDLTAKYRKGAKVRYKDGGAYDYGTVISSSYSSPNTTITLATNTDYVMAAATITDTYISYIENPEGFPPYFTFTPSWQNITVGAGYNSGRFKIQGNIIHLYAKWIFGAGAAITVDARFVLPVAAAVFNEGYWGQVCFYDNSATAGFLGLIRQDGYLKYYAVSGTLITQLYLQATSPFIWETDDAIIIDAVYSF